jgi:predicted GIY-YIG superfamily endonuclease
MLAATSNADVLRTKIKEDLDILDVDELQKLYQTLAAMAAEKAIKLANKDWTERFISREKISAEVEKYRKSKSK